MQGITTYTEFKQAVVEPDFRDFMSDQGNLRKAWHSAGSLFHLADWVYVAHKPTSDAKYKFIDDIGRTKPVSCATQFANSLGQIHPEFQLIRGVSNAAKHCELKSVPSGRKNRPGMPSRASDTYVSTRGFQSKAFQFNSFQIAVVKLQGDPRDIEFAPLAQSVLDMWDKLFIAEGW
jgi:hypothetical protein